MIHIDIKKLGRFKAPGHRITGWYTGMHRSGSAGWEYLHVCIDERSRVAFRAVMPDETARSAIAFLQAAVAYYQNFGITIERVMTDNGPYYTSKVFRNLCTDLNIPISAPDPTPREPTERLNDSYKPPQGMGLCSRLSDIHATMRPAPSLASSLQLAPTSQQSQKATTHQPVGP